MPRSLLPVILAIAVTLGAACDKQAGADEKRTTSASDAKRTSHKHSGHDGGKGNHDGGKGNHGADKGKFKIGRLDRGKIPESSGVIDSRKHPGVFWTFNDSGNGPTIFAVQRDGTLLNSYSLNVRNNDWEAITADDEGHLFVGDIGNNERNRDRVIVYRVDEPDPAGKPGAAGGAVAGVPLRVSGMWRLKFPDKPFDAESLFLFKGRGYIISKLLNGKNAGLYSFDLAPQQDAQTLRHECDLPIRAPVTDAALSRDGKRLAVMTVTGPYLFTGLEGEVTSVAKIEPTHVTYFDPGDLNMEGVCFVDEGLLATTEQGQILLFADEYFK
jgi:hypothetical protein